MTRKEKAAEKFRKKKERREVEEIRFIMTGHVRCPRCRKFYKGDSCIIGQIEVCMSCGQKWHAEIVAGLRANTVRRSSDALGRILRGKSGLMDTLEANE